MRLLRFQSLVMATVLGLASPVISTLGLLPEKSAIALFPDATVDNSGLAAPGDGLLTTAELLEIDLNAEEKTEKVRLVSAKQTEVHSDLTQGYYQLLRQIWEGESHSENQQHEEAIASFNAALSLLDNLENTFSEQLSKEQSAELTQLKSLVFLYLSDQYLVITEYQFALTYAEQGLDLASKINYLPLMAAALVSLGQIYNFLGQYQQSIDVCQSALSIHRENQALFQENESFEMLALNCIGSAYTGQNNDQEAVLFFQMALQVADKTEHPNLEISTLINLGFAYVRLGEYYRAVEALEAASALAKTLDNNELQEAYAVGNLGYAYSFVGRYDEAVSLLLEALPAVQETGHRRGEWLIYSAMGEVLAKMNEPELAILFYKRAVEINEAIREELVGLPDTLQHSYLSASTGLASIETRYRDLADLLLQQNRILEAQQVLDLLKVQELDDYLRGVERNAQTESGITLRPEEQEALERFNAAQSQLIELGRELLELEAIDLPERTPEQTNRIRELRQLQNNARIDFQTFLESDEIRNLVAQLRQTTGATNLELSELNALQDNLRRLDQNAIVLYPLILEDRLELIIVTANAPPLRRTVSVSREDLNRGIAEMRSALQSPSSDAMTPAQQLYDWLIRPIEDDLAQANADTIIYAPDSQLRYIPLAALHDGNQWLTERFRVNNITAASIDDLDNAPNSELHILAAAFSEGQYTLPIRDRTLSFGGLEYAGQEVENLSQLIPQTEKRLNEAFDSGIVLDMNDFSIVHLATHATFNPGPPEDSFILFGDGSKATLTDIKSWNFPNVELVVLSACETAVGDVPLGNGEEILGFGYLMQLAGADAAIASLWQVNDGGTQVLMNQFYSSLQQGHSKAEALRQAQVSLIESNLSTSEIERAGIDVVSDRSFPSTRRNLNHPYYWAPFILIGNGL